MSRSKLAVVLVLVLALALVVLGAGVALADPALPPAPTREDQRMMKVIVVGAVVAVGGGYAWYLRARHKRMMREAGLDEDGAV